MLYTVAKPPVVAVMRAIWGPSITGAEHLPERGPVILASNHLAYSDTVILPGLVDRPVHFLGKAEIFASRSVVGRIAGRVMKGLNVLPVDRNGGSASRGAISAGLALLEEGKVLGIYPEGTRSPDGRMYRGRTGVARLALASGAPIVPAAMLGSFEAQQGRRYLPRRRPRIRVVLGEPLDARALAVGVEGEDEAHRLRAVTDAVMDAIGELSGQDRCDEYASEAKKRLRAGKG